jgi:NAD(P)-dependent dehydrogenase (short-subunit alcohol dehydrogenase family)
VSSTAGSNVPHVGDNGTIMYSVSKAAAHVRFSRFMVRRSISIDNWQHLARNLAVELGPRNITTNTVAPGFFPSKLAAGLIDKLGGTEELEEANPRKRLGEPEDVAGVMVYLCAPAGSYM